MKLTKEVAIIEDLVKNSLAKWAKKVRFGGIMRKMEMALNFNFSLGSLEGVELS